MNEPILSVVIPCLNAAGSISRLLEELEHQTLSRDKYEVLVVDDGSTDDTCALVESFRNVRLYTQRRQGPGAARNRGIAESTGILVLFIDSDLEAAEDLLEQHLRFHQQHPEVAATGGSVVPLGPLPLFSWVLADHMASWFNAHPDAIHQTQPEYLPSLNFCVKRRPVIEEKELYWSPGLEYSGEDVLYCRELRRMGLEIAFVPQARVAHRDRASFARYCGHMYRWGHHAPFVRGRSADLKYSYLFAPRRGSLFFTVPLIIIGYTLLIWKSWAGVRPLAVTLALPQLFLGRVIYACGVITGTMARDRPQAPLSSGR